VSCVQAIVTFLWAFQGIIDQLSCCDLLGAARNRGSVIAAWVHCVTRVSGTSGSLLSRRLNDWCSHIKTLKMLGCSPPQQLPQARHRDADSQHWVLLDSNFCFLNSGTPRYEKEQLVLRSVSTDFRFGGSDLERKYISQRFFLLQNAAQKAAVLAPVTKGLLR